MKIRTLPLLIAALLSVGAAQANPTKTPAPSAAPAVPTAQQKILLDLGQPCRQRRKVPRPFIHPLGQIR